MDASVVLSKIRQCPNLPSLPAVALQILELAGRDETDLTQLARVVTRDPALTSKVLRTVNSSFYGRSQAVSSLSHALVILGMQSLKTIVLGFSLASQLSKAKPSGFDAVAYWKRSIYCATAAREWAHHLKVQQHEECFLAGLLADIGMLVLDQVLGADYSAVLPEGATHTQVVEAEQRAFGMTHAEVSAVLAEHWKLPAVLTTPMRFHHQHQQVSDPSLRRLSELVWLGSRSADVFVDREPAAAIAEVKQFCQGTYQLQEAECDAVLERIGKHTQEVASLFEIRIGQPEEYEAILNRANEALVELNLQMERRAAALEQMNQQLRQQAGSDPLTGLANRVAFERYVAEQFAIAQREKTCLSLVLLDVDGLRQVNEQCGHRAGDQVLRILGQFLKQAAREGDLAARYAGDELALVLPRTPSRVAASLAERIRLALASNRVPWGTQSIAVTVSGGVSTFDPGGPISTVDQLVKTADVAADAAKQAGHNCIKVFSARCPPNRSAA